MTTAIDSFRGRYFFLSNFYVGESFHVHLHGKLYLAATAEHAFQAYKAEVNDEEWRQRILGAPTPRAAKHLGRLCPLRHDWDAVKDQAMLLVLRAKFAAGLREYLRSTGDAALIEGNTWHDNYWGDCVCADCRGRQGHNRLGQLLMQVRGEL